MEESPAPLSASVETTEVKYGNIGNGEYITPFNMTAIYHEDSLFETAAAFLASRAQIIPIARQSSETIDYSSVAQSCEYITPEVLLFGTDFSRSDILKFFDRGFHFVHIFVYKIEDGEKYLESIGDLPKKEFDPRISVFSIDTFYDHLVLVEGLASVVAFEHVMIGLFPQHQPINKNLTHTEGKFFLNYIVDTKKHIGKILLELASSYKGYELINQMVISGRAMFEAREILANQRIVKGVLYTLDVSANVSAADVPVDNVAIDTTIIPPNAIAIGGCDLVEEMLQLLSVHPRIVKNNINYVIFYELAHTDVMPPQTTSRSWKITLVAIGKNASNTLEILRKYDTTNPQGTFGRSSGIISSPSNTQLKSDYIHSLLPFGI